MNDTKTETEKTTLVKSIAIHYFKIAAITAAILYVVGLRYFHGYIAYWNYVDTYYLDFHESIIWGLKSISSVIMPYWFIVAVIAPVIFLLVTILYFSYIASKDTRRPKLIYIYIMKFKRKRWLKRRKKLRAQLNDKAYQRKKQKRINRSNKNKTDLFMNRLETTYKISGLILLAPFAIFMLISIPYVIGKHSSEYTHQKIITEYAKGINESNNSSNLNQNGISQQSFFYNGSRVHGNGITLWCSTNDCGILMLDENMMYLIPKDEREGQKTTPFISAK